MALLIDGYNLLHVTGLVGRRGGLQGSREALLRFLASAGVATDKGGATIVFDATDAPPGLPRQTSFEGITVLYASGYPDADTLLEELIEADFTPRSLLVVSSDHRVQRAARRRRANFVDSDVWFAEAVRRRSTVQFTPDAVAKPSGPLSPREVAYWVEEFAPEEGGEEPNAPRNRQANEPPIDNPFPEGYGDDIVDDE